MHPPVSIALTRLKNLRAQVEQAVLAERLPFSSARYAPFRGRVPYRDREHLAYRRAVEGQIWGHAWESAWFHLEGAVPASWAESEVVAQVCVSGEVLVFDAEGCPWLGLTNSSSFDASHKKELIFLSQRVRGGEPISLWLEAAANGLVGVNRVAPEQLEDPSALHGHYAATIEALRLCRFDREAWQLATDLEVLIDLFEALPEGTRRKARVLAGLMHAADEFARKGVAAARAALKPLLDVPAGPDVLELVAVGHAHIDTGWLWPVRETIRKCARTFASQIDLINRYPEYVFGASQAQHYAFVKEHYPELYTKIQQAVRAGRWEVQGGMWVEADTNLTSGESLIRQLLFGKNFFRAEFGVQVKNLWLPDVFGYSGNLPQILSKAGCPYFLTQKLSWNAYNKFPHHTFLWQGIDGSEVLAHFPPESTYNAPVLPKTMLLADSSYAETGICDQALSLFGIGNGGGGPKEEHLERARRVRDLNGLPKYTLGAAQPVLESLARCAEALPVWVGELYLELHRGTLTTQGNIKRLNRRLEEALFGTEVLCSCLGLEAYPQAELAGIWKTLLLNQFHDILPGSSIHEVYEVAQAELEGGLAECRSLQERAIAAVGTAREGKTCVFNPSNHVFEGTVELGAAWSATLAGSFEVQAEPEGAVAWLRVPPLTALELEQQAGASVSACFVALSEGTPPVLENEQVRYEFDANLRLVRAFDKLQARELIAALRPANVLTLYDDRPHAWDAWEVDSYYEQTKLADAEAIGGIEALSGPVRSGLRATLRVGNSSVSQVVWLGKAGARLDFVTQVSWQERHKMLRVAFPTTLSASEASFEIQYGVVRRATHQNTGWERARFESLGHRFADLSEPDYGVALLNDCKYGYKVTRDTLDLNLLRSPTDPDPIADVGQHRFTYSLYPHARDLPHSDVAVQAAMLNQGVLVLPNSELTLPLEAPLELRGDGLTLGALKRAENERCFVVRIVETRGVRTRGRLSTRQETWEIVPTDLMEWEDEVDRRQQGSVELELAPFEIQTYRIWPR